jgi:hypothetical protein
MIFAKNDSSNDSAAFSNIGYSVARYRRRGWLERQIRNWRDSHVKPAPISLSKLIWLTCLFCFGVFMMGAGLTLCSGAISKRGGQAGEYPAVSAIDEREPFLDTKSYDSEKGNIWLK